MKNKKISLSSIFINLFLALFALTTLYPFVYILSYSLSDGNEAILNTIYLLPRGFTFENYTQIFQDVSFLTAYGITILRTIIGTFLHVFLSAIFAYALSQKALPGRRFISLFIFVPTVFGGGMIPTFILYRQLGLINNFWVYIIPFLYSFFHIIILRTFFQGLPDALEESARIDGASNMQIFFQIILPISKAVIATISLFQGVFHWNDWFTGEYFVTSDSLKPVQTLLNTLLNESDALANAAQRASQTGTTFGTMAMITPESLRMASVVVAVLPIICVYPFAQKHFSKGVMIGSMKE